MTRANGADVDVPASSGASTPAPAAARAPVRPAAKGKFADEDVEDEQVRHYRPISKGYL